MNPIVALALLGLAFVALRSFRPGVGAAGCAPIDPATVIANPQRQTIAQSTISGAAAGSALAAQTWGISIGVGALAGYFVRSSSNDTLIDRRTFAANLGFSSLDHLFQALRAMGRSDLVDQALNAIGRQDYSGNEAWQHNVLSAFLSAGYCL
jgi:hypothetical protein